MEAQGADTALAFPSEMEDSDLQNYQPSTLHWQCPHFRKEILFSNKCMHSQQAMLFSQFALPNTYHLLSAI